MAAPLLGCLLWRRRAATVDRGLLLALVVAGTCGFVVANLVSYARSWDIVKLFGVSAFFAHFLVAAWVARLQWPSFVAALLQA